MQNRLPILATNLGEEMKVNNISFSKSKMVKADMIRYGLSKKKAWQVITQSWSMFKTMRDKK